MKNIHSKDNSSKISSESVIWQGPEIPCLDLCTGDSVSNVLAAIGTQVCTIVTDIESLKDLDLSCLSQYCTNCPDVKTMSLKMIIQLLLNNDCDIKTRIDEISSAAAGASGGLVLNLNLKCIEEQLITICGFLPAVLEIDKVLQAIIDILCEVQSDVADILIRLIQIEQQVADLELNPGAAYNEPDIDDSCLNPAPYTATGLVPLPLSKHLVEVTDAEVCALREDVGSSADVDTSIALQCISDYLTNADIIKNPTSLAQTNINQWVILCDMATRIQHIQDSCCQVGCDDIKIGFTSTYDSGSNEYTLDFTFGAGTDIPLNFTDCGATITFTDAVNNTITVLTAGALVNGYSLTQAMGSLDISQAITVSIKTCFEDAVTGLTCKDCFGGTLTASIAEVADTCWTFTIPANIADTTSALVITYQSLVLTGGTHLISGDVSDAPATTSLLPTGLPAAVVSSTACTLVYPNSIILLELSGQSTVEPPILYIRLNDNAQTWSSQPVDVAVIGVLTDPCTC